MSLDQPTGLAGPLAAAVDRVREVALHRATEAVLEGDEPDAEAAALGRAEWLDQRWRRVVPAKFQRWRVADYPHAPQLAEWAHRKHSPANLVVLGPVGTGKTCAACAACRPAHDAGLEVRFLPVIELLDLLRPGGPEGALYDLADVDRLIVDDLGTERPTDWTRERLDALLNRRWMEDRPTVTTSNLPGTRKVAAEGYQGPTLDEHLGERLFSRVVGSGAVVVRLPGPDRRRA